ncbi:hypothetical protein ABL78_3333 [Leptomonas seymouri]|uniref:EF-hand domain-containing protein n=1 Tax=Leptomonas seymouri TaxID=5684 RepID=A0A0N1IL27_LEPSE|nr:hypothetical protein ABL78_3333 [Leptomonas seymouri]|eukprot:KPI87582.1 hypothetical protein ABL78_3333 [Leptomonas seymouri]
MSDSYSYSYSYNSSYTYDDYTSSATEEKVKAAPQPSARGANKGAKASAGESAVAAKKRKDNDTDSYNYSYSYSYSDSSPQQPHPPGKGAVSVKNKRKEAAADNGKGRNGSDSYSYSYSYSGDYSDYSYSYSDTDSQSEPMRRAGSTPVPAEVAVRKNAPLPIALSTKQPARQPTSKIPAAAAQPAIEDTESYSYSSSDSLPRDAGQRSKRPAAQAPSSDSYYYSDDYGSSYSYTDDGSYYTDSYSYTGDSSYYYSPSTNASHARKDKKAADDDDNSSYYYYSDSYPSDYSYYTGSTYYYSEESYYYSDSYEDSDYYYYYSSSASVSSSSYYYDDEEGESSKEDNYDYSSVSSYTYSAESKSESSTTSSYGYTSSSPSVMSVTESLKVQRDTVLLRAPTKDTPHVPAAPRRCFVVPQSVEDGVWAFLQRLMRLQQAYEERRKAATTLAPSFVPRAPPAGPVAAAAAAAGGVPESTGGKDEGTKGKKKSKSKGKNNSKEVRVKQEAASDVPDVDEETLDTATAAAKPFIPTKEGCFSERSLRIAFQVLRLNHLERTEALKNAPVPLPMETMVDIYSTCVAARAKERVAQAFLAHDTYRSGEISLSVMGGLLRRLGMGTSPVMQGFRISLCASSGTFPEMVMNVEQLVEAPARDSAAAEAEDEQQGGKDGSAGPSAPQSQTKKSLQWEVTPVYVSRIVRKNAAAKKPTPVHWAHNTIYMGRHVVVRNVTSEELFERLKTYIEAATYLCVLTDIFTIHDAENGTVTVQYPQFVRSVLLAQPPASRHAHPTAAPAPPMKLLAIENLFRAVFHPMEVLRSFEAGRGFPRYLHDWAVESTLHATNDTEEKRRRNVVPSITADNVRFIPAPPARHPTEAQLSFLLQKVRVPGRPPAGARCFCLVSAVTATNVFLPAIEVPVRGIVKSSKDPDGYTWIFYDNKHHKKDTTLCFAGPATDRIYVECCYETRSPPLTSEVEGAETNTAGSATLADTEVATVWCAGYVVFAVEGAKTTALPVSMGSLLQSGQAASISANPSGRAATTAAAANPGAHAADGKIGKSPAGLFCFVSRLCKHKRKMAPEMASNIKIEVMKNKKPVTGAEKLPARFIDYQRHIPMIAQLRTAVELVGKETTYASQAFRQQAVRYIFAVAADASLLDQLCALWAHRTKHWSKAERKDEKQQHAQLLSCVASLYALNNCCAGSKHQFAQALVKEKSLQISLDASAPLLPVRV